MSQFFTIKLLIALSFPYILIGVQLPSYINSCKTTDEDCLKSSIQDAISKLREGDKDLGILPLKVLQLNNMTAKESEIMPTQLLSNIVIYGLTENVTVDSVKITLNPCNINFNLRSFGVHLNVTFAFKKKYESVDVDVVDDVTVIFDVINLPIYTKCQIYKKNDLDFLNITNVAVDISVVFKDIEFVNKENNVYKSFLDNPAFYVQGDIFWDELILNSANKIFNNIPVKELFRD